MARNERNDRIGTAALMALAAAFPVSLFARSRTKRKLKRTEQWLTSTLREITDAVITTDERGRVHSLNPVASRLTGWSTRDARGRPLSEVFRVIEEEPPVVNPVVDTAGTEPNGHEPPEEPVIHNRRPLLIRRDGSSVRIDVTGASGGSHNGRKPRNGVVVFRDASAQTATEAALAANEERLRLAVEGAELGTWDLDLGSEELTCNPQFERIMGIEAGSRVTRDVLRARVVPEDLETLKQATERARVSHKPFNVEFRMLRPNDPVERWISVLGRYQYDQAGRPVRMMGIVNDITERRRLEQRVRQAQRLDALGTLAGGIAHDFNNILSIMRGNLLLIEADLPPGDPIAPAISEMSRACARARDLVRQILTFGRQQEQDRKIISLTGVIEEALKLLRSTVPASIEIRSRFAPNLPTVLADASQIHQVVMNLGINASQAIGRGAGVITVNLDEVHVDASTASHSPDLNEGRYVRLRFGDSGSGMTREVMEHIFEPFFTTRPQGTGTGLGLAVVRGIVKSHDGAITVYSEPGKGTQFQLYFPVVEGSSTQPAQNAATLVRGEGQHILYLDDEPALVILARRLLERLGYKVSGFSDAAEALAAFEAAPADFDLVLSDLSMPGLSGLDVARRVLEIRPEIPVLLASGYVRTEDVEAARELGVREVIWKPTTINEMGELLRRTLATIIPRTS